MRRALLLAFVIALCIPTWVGAQSVPQAMQGQPGDAAFYLSVLESQGSWDQLYDLMHPSALAVVPREAVIGWYGNDFGPLGPGPITVTGVENTTWTWEVTGETFPTMVVSFIQPFKDGSTVSDVVRLVWTGNRWGWFFGRSRAFVDEQVAKYGGSAGLESPASTAQEPNSTLSPSVSDRCAGDPDWWAATSSGLDLAHQFEGRNGRFWLNGQVGPDDWTIAKGLFDSLYQDQLTRPYPVAAADLHKYALDYYLAVSRLVNLVGVGGPDPLSIRAAQAARVKAITKIAEVESQRPSEDAFLSECQPTAAIREGLYGLAFAV